MARRRKKPQSEPGAAEKPSRVGTDLGDLLRRELSRARQPKPAAPDSGPAAAPKGPPSPPPAQTPAAGAPDVEVPAAAPDARSLRLLNDAYAGATPLRATRQGRSAAPATRAIAAPGLPAASADSEDAEARARLDSLVGGGVRFAVERDEDGRYSGLREGVARSVLRRLRGPDYTAEATLDLHGMRAEEAARAIARFVRERHRRGARYLLIVHGAGNHSEAGLSVLAPRTVEALTGGGAAPLVQAFATAHTRRGGLGALAVLLK